MIQRYYVSPSWDKLYEIASGQEGHFTSTQAAEAGYSLPLLAHHLHKGRIAHAQRGIYRLVHYPAGEHDDLMILWLWSGQEGVFSHETALALHGLSDVLPFRVHLTLPKTREKRRMKFPEVLVPHFADLPAEDRAWVGSIPVTTPGRTVLDCASAHVSPELVAQAIQEGLERGLFTVESVAAAREYARAFDLELA